MNDDTVETVDGLTRDEWRARLAEEGLDDAVIEHIIAVSFGDLPGDAIDLDEYPELDDERRNQGMMPKGEARRLI